MTFSNLVQPIMKTFWIYFSIFLVLSFITQVFLYFSGDELYQLDIKHAILQLAIITLTAFLTSMILRKRKNDYNEKANK